MISTSRYFVYPRTSHSTNFADAGVHHMAGALHLQVPLQTFAKDSYRLIPLRESTAVYDAHCEIGASELRRLAPHLEDYSFAVDLYGTKDLDRVEEPYILTCRRGPKPLKRYARSLRPHEMNVVLGIEGNALFLHETATCERTYAGLQMPRLEYYYGLPQKILVRWRGYRETRS
jgi:hypothetical protein